MKFWFKLRGALMLPPVAFCLVFFRGEIENEILVWTSGGIFFGLGFTLRLWCQMHLHYRLKIRKILTTTGPYSYVRNPIYIANTSMLIGCALVSELFWMAPIMLIYCAIVYSLVVRYEESHLFQKYGSDYAGYLEQVPRWLPRRRPIPCCYVENPRRFLPTSILAEIHNLLLLIPFIVKEFIL